MSGTFYNSYTYYYRINKTSKTYFYFAPPSCRYQGAISNIEVYSTNTLEYQYGFALV